MMNGSKRGLDRPHLDESDATHPRLGSLIRHIRNYPRRGSATSRLKNATKPPPGDWLDLTDDADCAVQADLPAPRPSSRESVATGDSRSWATSELVGFLGDGCL